MVSFPILNCAKYVMLALCVVIVKMDSEIIIYLCVVWCLRQGVLVQCHVAHRYPPGNPFPLINCATYVMLARYVVTVKMDS